MSKSWILLEVDQVAGEKTMKALAGTEDRTAAIRMLAALRRYKQECIRNGKTDLSLIHSTVLEEAENPSVHEVAEESSDLDRLLSLVDTKD